MAKTLSESAAEILKASMNAGKEPMQSLGAPVQDLGGATPSDDYSGGPGHGEKDIDPSVGLTASAGVKPAPRPGQSSEPGDVKANSVRSKGLAAPATVDATLHPDLAEETEDESEDKDDEDEDEEDKEEMDEEVDAIEEEEFDRTAALKEMVAKHKGTMREDIDALFNGESLSEDFRVKATLIFEAAVTSRIEAILEEVVAENDNILEGAIEEIKSELTEQVDEYLNYVVEEWVSENEVAIETGLRAELTEDFITGLKALFEEHYIEIPEEKADVAEELAATVVEMQEALAEQEEAIAALSEEVNKVKKAEAIARVCEGLTAVQAGKLKSLAEGVEFTTEGDFDNKLAVIRENYFPNNKSTVKSEVKTLQETTIPEENEVEEVHGIMAHYVKAITKTAPKA